MTVGGSRGEVALRAMSRVVVVPLLALLQLPAERFAIRLVQQDIPDGDRGRFGKPSGQGSCGYLPCENFKTVPKPVLQMATT